MRRYLPLALLALLAACHDSTGPDAKITALVVVPSPLYVALGDTSRLFAHGTGAVAGTYVNVSPRYTSLDPAVATVTADGLARGVAVGTARIVAQAGGHADTVAVNVLALPAVRTFNVSTGGDQCGQTEYHGARVAATSAHAVIYEDVANPPGGFTPAEYAEIADEFERIVWPTDTHAFGTPTDLDGNGHVDILYTRAVNELTPAHVGYIVGGFFDPRDVFPRAGGNGVDACPGSNYAEMFYILVPDSAGSINGNVRTKEFVRQTTVGTLAHELQHLINASRRMYVNHADSAEVVWLDEGLSHVAEELAFQAASGIGPRQDVGRAQLATAGAAEAYETFGGANVARLGTYLQATEANSPWAHDDQLETRGATWSLLRYLADRRGGDETAFWYALANAKTFGMTNLETALGADPVLWARDWSVANYADDVVPVAAEFTHPSWNFRDLFVNSSFGGYPLRPIPLGSRAGNVTIKSGSAAYLRFGVAQNGQGEVRFSQGTATVTGDCTPLLISAAEVQTFTLPAAGLALCFPGGAGTSAEYTVAAYHGSEVSDVLYSLHVAGQNLALASTLTDRLPSPAPAVRADAAPGAKPYDGGWEMAFRERAWRSLAPRVQRFREHPRFASAAANSPSTMYIAVLRTK